MVSIKDISKITGYSITTVSKAMNGYPDVAKATREKILQVCKEQGYIPSSLGRNLSTKRTYTIGVVFSEETNQGITHPFFGELLNYFKDKLAEEGYDILLLGNRVGRFVRSYKEHCVTKSVDGVIILSAYPDEEGIKELVASDIPKVIMQSDFDNQNCFFSDNVKAINDVVEHLYSYGHRKIGFIYGDPGTHDGASRLEGYRLALEKFNLPYNEDLIYPGMFYTIDEGREAGRQMIAKGNLPTAVVCGSDTLAVGLALELMSNGYKIPEDISITGFDNISLSKVMRPEITTVDQDKPELARLAVRCLVHEIETGNKQAKKYVVPTKMIYRDSVAKIK